MYQRYLVHIGISQIFHIISYPVNDIWHQVVSYHVIRSGYYPEWRENERIGVIDTTWCHKGVSLKGYLTTKIWDLVVVNRLGTKNFRFLIDSSEINDPVGTFATWIIRVKPDNTGITKIFDSTETVISSDKFSNFLLPKTLCRKITVSQSIFDVQSRSKTCFRHSALVWAQYAEN